LIRVGIVGATGYGGRELLRLLVAHPEVELTAIASTSVAGERLDAVLPAFRGTCALVFEPFDAAALAARCDVVYLGVPSKLSAEPGEALRNAGVRVIDIGPDFRLKSLESFKAYYGIDHPAPARLNEAVYGLVPANREAIRTADLVAVPGCYPISVLIPLWPLRNAGIDAVPVVATCMSGISGAGRTPNDRLHFPEMNENAWAYKLGVHQHVPEIEQALEHRLTVQFTPHVIPVTRGIHTTIVARPAEQLDPGALFAAYDDEPFIRVLGEGATPELAHVRASNFCDFGWYWDERTKNLMLISAIDNLVGGTAGMAIQCMNLMFGLDERAGIPGVGMTP